LALALLKALLIALLLKIANAKMPAKLIALQKELLMLCNEDDIVLSLYKKLGAGPRVLLVPCQEL
jgi:hypothetical protein